MQRNISLGSKHRVGNLFEAKRVDKDYKAAVKSYTHEAVAEVFIAASHDLVKIIVAYSLKAKKQ